MTHSKECIEFTENSLTSCIYGIECICENCLCHYCQYRDNTEYRKKYINEYYKKHEALLK